MKKEEAIFSTATMAVVALCVEMAFTLTIFVKSQSLKSSVIHTANSMKVRTKKKLSLKSNVTNLLKIGFKVLKFKNYKMLQILPRNVRLNCVSTQSEQGVMAANLRSVFLKRAM